MSNFLDILIKSGNGQELQKFMEEIGLKEIYLNQADVFIYRAVQYNNFDAVKYFIEFWLKYEQDADLPKFLLFIENISDEIRVNRQKQSFIYNYLQYIKRNINNIYNYLRSNEYNQENGFPNKKRKIEAL